ncbi:hypothetical protein R1flu_008129 [Riccia fluitans]|uniref:Rab-GAP TBC domain-containing protein n=1 Tax=Riccia fluitans TaxID=41844 RepID=A0ABD1YEF6_9MARC
MPKERALIGGRTEAPTPTEQSRDMYGFMVRPQHLERYREYCPIYKEEEAERSERWDQFLRTLEESASASSRLDLLSTVPSVSMNSRNGHVEDQEAYDDQKASTLQADRIIIDANPGTTKIWGQLRKSLWAIERAGDIRHRGTKKHSLNEKVHLAITDDAATGEGLQGKLSKEVIDVVKDIHTTGHANEDVAIPRNSCITTKEGAVGVHEEGFGEGTEEKFQNAAESTNYGENMVRSIGYTTISDAIKPEAIDSDCPWDAELRSLVRGGVPMALRGELWQVFVGTKKRRTYGHYNALLTLLADGGGDSDGVGGLVERKDTTASNYIASKRGILEKWTSQIEKDLPRTFPGHPALDEDGRNALRRLLTAYARHNPSVGYCQAMNFLAALLLLLMPEENSFWTLTGIIDDYFEGYYSEKMLEAQVDQLVFEDLVREHFPRLVNHLDSLGVRVAWVSGPWFLSIFVNVLPWESVLRVWDVLLFEGNRCMLFRTALALMEMNGPALSATRDAGDAVAFLQSMAGATFDSSQLVMMACIGFQSVTESTLQKLRVKHQPAVLAALEERTNEVTVWRNSIAALKPSLRSKEGSGGDSLVIQKPILLPAAKLDDVFLQPPLTPAAIDAQRLGLTFKPRMSFTEISINDSLANETDTGSDENEEENNSDLREQVKWLKDELNHSLEEQKTAVARAEELETALVELSMQDNRRLLAATVEKLEAEVAEMRSILAQKEEHEASLVQVIVRMEQEQAIADDARRFSEQDAAAQRQAAELLQANFEAATEALKEMEKRAVMAESMLEATVSYQQLGNNSPHGSFRRSSMGPLLVRPSESPVGSPLVKNAGISRSHSGGVNGLNKQENQGIFGRRFSLNWRDTSK